MPQPCKICRHADRQAIDAVLLKGWPSLRVIGAQYSVSKDSLLRHYRAHTPDDADSEPRQMGEIAEQKKGPEARQVAEVVEQKKEPEPNESPWAVSPDRVRQKIEEIRARLRKAGYGA